MPGSLSRSSLSPQAVKGSLSGIRHKCFLNRNMVRHASRQREKNVFHLRDTSLFSVPGIFLPAFLRSVNGRADLSSTLIVVGRLFPHCRDILSLHTYNVTYLVPIWIPTGALSASNSSAIHLDGTTWFDNNSASSGGE